MTSRVALLAATLAATSLVMLPTALRIRPRLLWNASASVPIGLYAVRPAGRLHVDELVIVMPPEPLASFLAARGYLPKGVPLVKHVLALSEQTVCRTASTITVDGREVGVALARDRRGRTLPGWQGCRVLGDDEVFLMNRLSEDSFDGRYFGPLPVTSIAGRADPLWTEQGQ